MALRALLTFGTIRAILIRTTLGTGAARPEGVLIPFVGDAGAVVAAGPARSAGLIDAVADGVVDIRFLGKDTVADI